VPPLTIGRVNYVGAPAIQGDLSSKLELSDILQHRQKALFAAVPFVSLLADLFANSGSGRQVLRDRPCRATVLSAVG
jgi:hypothetical protein